MVWLHRAQHVRVHVDVEAAGVGFMACYGAGERQRYQITRGRLTEVTRVGTCSTIRRGDRHVGRAQRATEGILRAPEDEGGQRLEAVHGGGERGCRLGARPERLDLYQIRSIPVLCK